MIKDLNNNVNYSYTYNEKNPWQLEDKPPDILGK